jgi:hypothetical protein
MFSMLDYLCLVCEYPVLVCEYLVLVHGSLPSVVGMVTRHQWPAVPQHIYLYHAQHMEKIQ